MKELNHTKETYERSSLVITSFPKEDVIVTSPAIWESFFGDNDSNIMKPNR